MACILTLCASCKNSDEPGRKELPFKFNGQAYRTLNEAVNAALDTESLSTPVISLAADASGSGVVMTDYSGRSIIFDFLNHTYKLNQGGQFLLGDNNVVFTGDGGGIKCQGTDWAIRGEGGNILVNRNFNLSGGNIIRSSSEVYVESSFRGSLSGNILVDKTQMYIFSSNCKISIPYLAVKGQDATLSVDTGDGSTGEIIKIGRVDSDVEYPVVSVGRGSVKINDGIVHIHHLSEEITSGNCVTPARIHQFCHECGYERLLSYNEEQYGSCNSAEFIHYQASEGDELNFGNVEYWQCPLCGRYYSDPEGKDEMVDGPFTFPEIYDLAYLLLHQFDGQLDWTKEFGQFSQSNDVGLIIGILGTIATVAFGIEALIDNPKSFDEINDKLDKMKVQLDQIQSSINILLKQMQKLISAEPIRTRCKYTDNLKVKSRTAFTVIADELHSTKSTSDKKKEIKNVVADWNKEQLFGFKPSELTRTLIRDFCNKDQISGMTVTKMYEQLVNGATKWEHDGYNMRYQMLLNDLFTSGISYILTGIYIKEVADYQSEAFRNKELEILTNEFDNYSKEIKKELELIKYRDDNFRHLTPKNITYDREVSGIYDFYSWFKNNRSYCFPRNNHNGVAVRSCNVILKDNGLSGVDYITSEQAKFIYSMYNKKDSPVVPLYRILADTVDFIGCPSSSDPDLIIAKNDGGFGHEDGDSAIPVYKIFHWESYRSSCGNDYFGIRSCLDERGNEVNHNILFKCDIQSRDTGNIKDIGKPTKWNMMTIFVTSKNPTPNYFN